LITLRAAPFGRRLILHVVQAGNIQYCARCIARCRLCKPAWFWFFYIALYDLRSLKGIIVLLLVSLISGRVGPTGSYSCLTCPAGTYSTVLGSPNANLRFVATDALIVLLSV